MLFIPKLPVLRKPSPCIILFPVTISIFLLLMTCATPSVLVTQEQKLGDNYFNNHDYPEAAKHYELMLNSSSKLGIYRNLSMESDVHRKIANCQEMTGNYDQALDHVHEAMKLDSADNNLLGRIEDYRHEGKIFIYKGSYQKSILSVEKSLALSEGMEQSLKNTHRLTIADNYLVLGQLYSVMGRIDKSLEYSNQALTIFRQAADRRGEMESILTIGSAYSDLGDLFTAQSLTEQSLKIAEEINMGTSRHYQLLAGINSSLGKYEDALRFQEKALQDAAKYKIQGQIIWADVGMGDIYRDLGDVRKAGRYYNLARQIKDTTSINAGSLEASLDLRLGDIVSANEYFTSEGSLTGAGISSLRLSEMLIQNNKPDSALIFLGQSGGIFKSSRNLQGIANVQLLKGRLLVDKGENARAKQLLDSARMATDFPETVWQAWFHLGRIYENLGQDDRAIDSYRNSIAVIEKIRGNLTIDEFKSIYFDSKRQVYDRLINLLLKKNNTVDAFQVSEQARARAFYDILSNRKINFKGSVSGDLIAMEQEKRIEMQKLYKLLQKGYSGASESGSSRSVDVRQVRNALTEVQTEYEDIISKIKLNNKAYTGMVAAEPVNLPDIQSRIDPKTAVLEYWISDNDLIIWFITHSGIISRSVKISSKNIGSLVENTRRYLQLNSFEEMKAGLSELYRILIGPFETEISSFSNLIIIPNQSLHFLPFQALMNKKGEYMVQKFNFVYAPSASVYIVCNDRLIKSGSKFMGMALSDVAIGNNVGLPGTEEELKKILPLFSDNISTFGKQSTETFARANAGNYNFIHFATHGSYNYRQPLYSFLLFPPSEEDDGRLNVYEVFEMNLNAKLVTLSACETGLGNISQGDELTGLSRAFLFAGSSSVIVSLWSVADYPTSILMTNFYRYLRDHPMQEALTMAQRDVIRQFPQPAYWAPFILIGNGNISGY
ncbi:MAG: CHAT domain-containing protein [Bacteroidia bacterium]|nr:CHAT domain-containing protein [Bacteroidia bacterium]